MLSPRLHNLSDDDIREIGALVKPQFLTAVHDMRITNIAEQDLFDIYLPLAAVLRHYTQGRNTPVIGINGAQGAGKSTLCRLLELVLAEGFKKRVATLSIDDLYLTRRQRQTLAKQVHPLLITRGVPGTHDVKLGMRLISALRRLETGDSLALPVFDKAMDDRQDAENWRIVDGPIDLILFEGWCVGARPQADNDLIEPVNRLEQNEDPYFIWRRYVNQQLAEQYQTLFAELSGLIMLKVPGMESVYAWRALQEQQLASTNARQVAQAIMAPQDLARFIMHYERLTRWMLAEMPERADLVLELNNAHRVARTLCPQNSSLNTTDCCREF